MITIHPDTIPEALRRVACHHGEAIAIDVAGDRMTTYHDLHSAASRLSAFIDSTVPAKTHIAVLMPNSVAWAEAMYGATLSGRTAVLLNPRLTASELAYQLTQSDTRLAFVDGLASNLRGALEERLPDVVFTTTEATPDYRARALCSSSNPSAPALHHVVDPESTAVIIYTSGTTSAPKGVELSHSALLRNAAGVADRFALTEDDKVFGAGPFFHSGGLTMHILMCALHGAAAHSIVRFDPDEVVNLIEDLGITVYSGIETLFLRLLSAEGFDPVKLRSVRTGWTTGTPSILRIITEKVGIPGIVAVYGISEAGPNVIMSAVDDPEELRLQTVGRPLDGVEARVVDPETGRDVRDGERGELLVRSASLMNGYYSKPLETADTVRDGWLHTGDVLIRRPDGHFEFGGRSKDTVRTLGENVSCAEVEDAIYAHTDVSLTAVVALPDPERGEVVAAAIVPGETRSVTTGADLVEALKPHLAPYKLPRRVAVLDELPMTTTGKVRKAGLTDIMLAEGTHP